MPASYMSRSHASRPRRQRLASSSFKMTLLASFSLSCELDDTCSIPLASASPQRLRSHPNDSGLTSTTPVSPQRLRLHLNDSRTASTTMAASRPLPRRPARQIQLQCSSVVPSCEAMEIRPPSGVIWYVMHFLQVSWALTPRCFVQLSPLPSLSSASFALALKRDLHSRLYFQFNHLPLASYTTTLALALKRDLHLRLQDSPLLSPPSSPLTLAFDPSMSSSHLKFPAPTRSYPALS